MLAEGLAVPPPELGATNHVRTSVTVVIADADVTTVAIGIIVAVKPVVFAAGTQFEAGFR